MVTIKDIARECNVAVSTVSRALADSKLIPESTRKRIKENAKNMGYIPNSLAKQLRTKQTRSIGVFSFVGKHLGFSHYLFSKVLDSFMHEACNYDYDIVLLSENLLKNNENLVNYCKSRNLEGVLVLCGDLKEKPLQELISSVIPVVVIDGFDLNLSKATYCISSNNREMMFDLTEHVISMGHKDIVFITGNEQFYVTHERKQGFLSALKYHGIQFRDEMLVSGSYYDLNEIDKHLRAVLSRKNLPSCILLPDDYSAVRVYTLLQEYGLQIGKNISLTGYDGLEFAEQLAPRLTTVEQNTKQIGILAAQTFIKVSKGEEVPYMQLVKSKLLIGESVYKI